MINKQLQKYYECGKEFVDLRVVIHVAKPTNFVVILSFNTEFVFDEIVFFDGHIT